MNSLNDRHKQLLLDYALGMASQPDSEQAKALLASNAEVDELYRLFKSALSPLSSLSPEPCPDHLANRTVARLKAEARADAADPELHQLLAAEQSLLGQHKLPILRNWREAIAAAAAVILFISVLLPALGLTREKYRQFRCSANLADLSNALFSYASDYEGLLPTVAMERGAPWWKVGYAGTENYSNTRRGWLLVRQEYVAPNRFICPARRVPRRPDFAALKIDEHNDFPSRAYIHYSIRIGCPDTKERCSELRRIVLADLNPLSEGLPNDHSSALNIQLGKELLASNSRNHNGRGQNLLHTNGSVEYTKVRCSTFSEDDIYTLQIMSCGQRIHGHELPSCEKDTFLAP